MYEESVAERKRLDGDDRGTVCGRGAYILDLVHSAYQPEPWRKRCIDQERREEAKREQCIAAEIQAHNSPGSKREVKRGLPRTRYWLVEEAGIDMKRGAREKRAGQSAPTL